MLGEQEHQGMHVSNRGWRECAVAITVAVVAAHAIPTISLHFFAVTTSSKDQIYRIIHRLRMQIVEEC